MRRSGSDLAGGSRSPETEYEHAEDIASSQTERGRTVTRTALATLTALDAVRSGQCSGICLVANPDTASTCDCSCDGMFHGVLAEAELTARHKPVEPEGPKVPYFSA